MMEKNIKKIAFLSICVILFLIFSFIPVYAETPETEITIKGYETTSNYKNGIVAFTANGKAIDSRKHVFLVEGEWSPSKQIVITIEAELPFAAENIACKGAFDDFDNTPANETPGKSFFLSSGRPVIKMIETTENDGSTSFEIKYGVRTKAQNAYQYTNSSLAYASYYFKISAKNSQTDKIEDYIVILTNKDSKNVSLSEELYGSVQNISLKNNNRNEIMEGDAEISNLGAGTEKFKYLELPANIDNISAVVNRAQSEIGTINLNAGKDNSFYWMCVGLNYLSVNGDSWKLFNPISQRYSGQYASQPIQLKKGYNCLNLVFITSKPNFTWGLKDGQEYIDDTNISIPFLDKSDNNITRNAVIVPYIIYWDGEEKNASLSNDATVSEINALSYPETYKTPDKYTITKDKNADSWKLILPDDENVNKILLEVLPVVGGTTVKIKGAEESEGGYFKDGGAQCGNYYAVDLNNLNKTAENGNSVIEMTVTALDGTEKTYDIEILKSSSKCDLMTMNIDGANIDDFDKDLKAGKTEYYLNVSENSNVTFKNICVSDEASVTINGEKLSENSYSFAPDDITRMTITAQDGQTSKTYLFIHSYKDGRMPYFISSDATKQKAKEMLDAGWNQRSEEDKKNLLGGCWPIFEACATYENIDNSVTYDMVTHTYKQNTDYARSIIQAAMSGDNPYKYVDANGTRLVDYLKAHYSEGGYANPIFALLGLRVAGENIPEKLLNNVISLAENPNFDPDMRGWALAAVADIIPKKDVARLVESFRSIQRTKGDEKGMFYNFWYPYSNVESHGCVLMGLAGAGIDVEKQFALEDGTTPLFALKKYQISNGMFNYYLNGGGDTTYWKCAIIALGDIINGNNVWQRYCLTREKFDNLVLIAGRMVEENSTDEKQAALKSAYNAAKQVDSSAISGFGEQYYNLYDAVAAIDESAVNKPHNVRMLRSMKDNDAIDEVNELTKKFDGKDVYENAESVIKAKESYDALGEGQDEDYIARMKGYVEHADAITKAYQAIESIIPVINAIDTLPDTATLADEAAIDAADELYKALSEQEQKGVYNYSKIASLRKQIDKIKSDQAAVTNVISLINALPDASRVTVADETKINHANQAYNALDASLKEQITNVYKLIEVQRKLTNLLEAQAVIDKISSIGTLTVQNFADKEVPVIEARTLYNALTTEQKTLVTNYSLLEDAEVFIKENKVDADIADIIGKIDELRTTSDPAGNRIDGPLKETEKNNGVPTKAIWDSWKDYVVNVRGLVDGIDSSRQSLISNLSSLVKAEDYIRQLNFQELKDMMNALPDASVIAPYTASERAGAEPAEVFEEETSVVESVDTEEIAQSAEEISEEAETQEVISVETADPEALPEEEIPEYVGASRRPLTDTEITELVDAEMAFEVLSAADQKAFDEQNTSLVANMNALLEMAETYPVYKTQKLQKFADNASKVYAQIMEVPVTCDTLASVQALLDTYNNCYGSDKEALASVTVTVGNKTISFADVIAEIQKQVDKTTKNVAEAREIDEWIMNLPTELTPANIDSVEKEVKAVKAAIEKLGTEGTSYLYNKKQLELVEQLVTNYRRAQKEKEEQEKAAFKEHKITGMKAVSLSYNSAQITWSELSEADGYQVYAKSSRGGTYKKIATITEKETICYTHKNLTTGETYYYKVRAYATISGEKIYSGFSSVKTAKIVPTAVKLSSAQAKGTSATVKWYKVSGASGYAVYRATSQNGKYTRVGTIKKGSTVSYTDSGLKSKKDYYYKVRAYRTVNGKNVYGSYSAVKQVYSGFSAMKFSSVQAKSTSIILKWYKVSGASGYAVYRATSQNGKYTRVGTIKKGSTVSYTDSRLKSKKNYYYKVRAYRTVNGKNVYGSYSAVKKVKTK